MVPNASITYCRPPTVGTQLLNYKKISHDPIQDKHQKFSKKCGNCGLCGNWGRLHNMVCDAHSFKDKNGVNFKSKHHLNCKDYGIYAGQCLLCSNFYVGQSSNAFSVRWNTHRTTWRKMVQRAAKCKDDGGDDQALYAHYYKYHPEALTSKDLALSDAYRVIFLEKPPLQDLDIKESFWVAKINAKINIMRTCLPRYRSSNF